ncbi:MAG: hypothetical protein B7X06_00235 [Verrucomicrobia bacterium 21-51-4]|nr:MAG: hypothetical protein B7X06_00235 [Verrucomicrobia bacterium 21-51-4]HQU08893.1 RDD family protein [Opitutales bacterium]
MDSFNESNQQKFPDAQAPRPARIYLRIIAFLLDFVLIALLSTVLLGRFILPYQFPDAMAELNAMIDQYMASGKLPDNLLNLPPSVQNMVHFAQGFTLILWWVYFSALEIGFQGGSLGKKMFKLRAVYYNNGEALSLFGHIIRSAFKTLILLSYFPLLIVNALFMFFNSSRRAGHDYLCRSMVIEED